MDLFSSRARNDTKYIIQEIVPYLETHLDDKLAGIITSQSDPQLDTIPWIYALHRLHNARHNGGGDARHEQSFGDMSSARMDELELASDTLRRFFIFCRNFNFELSLLRDAMLVDLIKRAHQLFTKYTNKKNGARLLRYSDRSGFLHSIGLIVHRLNERTASESSDQAGPLLTCVHSILVKVAVEENNLTAVEKYIVNVHYAGAEIDSVLAPTARDVFDFFLGCGDLYIRNRLYEQAIDSLTIAKSIGADIGEERANGYGPMRRSEVTAKLREKLHILWILACLADQGKLHNEPNCVSDYNRIHVPSKGISVQTSAGGVPEEAVVVPSFGGGSTEGDIFSQEDVGASNVHPKKVHKSRRGNDKSFRQVPTSELGFGELIEVEEEEEEERRLGLVQREPGSRGRRIGPYYELERAFETQRLEAIHHVFKLHGEKFLKDAAGSILEDIAIRFKERYIQEQIAKSFSSMDIRLFEMSQIDASNSDHVKQIVCHMVMQHKLESCYVEFTEEKDMHLYSISEELCGGACEAMIDKLDLTIGHLLRQFKISDNTATQITENGAEELKLAHRRLNVSRDFDARRTLSRDNKLSERYPIPGNLTMEDITAQHDSQDDEGTETPGGEDSDIGGARRQELATEVSESETDF